MKMRLNGLNIGFAMCGSFCTFEKALDQIKEILGNGASIIPIMSETAADTDTRFGEARDFIRIIEGLTGHNVICQIEEAEKIGPNNLVDIIVIAPCTGNTLAKLARGITDTTVLMAVKGHIRNNKPVCIAISTNDALGINLENIGKLLNIKNIYFVPFGQDNPVSKPKSMTADFERIVETIEAALKKEQIQPVISGNNHNSDMSK